MKHYFLGMILLLLTISSPIIAGVPFSDMPDNHWATDSVNKMVSIGILSGYPDGTFNGLKTINRYELALYLSKIISYIDNKFDPSKKNIFSPSENEMGQGAGIKQLTLEVTQLKKEVSALKSELALLKKKN